MSVFVLCSNALAATVLAETGPAPSELEEIIVTATKRADSIQKVPISISALSSKAMEASGVKGIEELANVVPGVEFDALGNYGAGTSSNIAVRGVNSVGGASTTGIYIDDTSVGSRIDALSAFGNPYPVVFDLDRVEVDRGPQGTLFGAGAEGGAVRFISTSPSLKTYSGVVHAEGADTKGGNPSYEMGAAVGGPIIVDTLGFRVSAWDRKDGGWVDRVNPFTKSVVEANSNYKESEAFRGALAWRPVEGLLVTPSAFYQDIKVHDTGAHFNYLSNPDEGVYHNGRLMAQPATDGLHLYTLKVEANLGFADFTSISSYLDRRSRAYAEFDGYLGGYFTQYDPITGAPLSANVLNSNPYPGYGNPLGASAPLTYNDLSNQLAVLKQQSYSEEARLASSDPDARLKWVTGIYAVRTRQYEADLTYSNDIASLYGVPSSASVYTQSYETIDKQLALFGQADYRIIDNLTATVGLRVARTTFNSTILSSGVLLAGVPAIQDEVSETPVTPKFGLSYQLDDNNMIYASIGKGYRVGGVNPSLPSICGVTAAPAVKSDSLWSYELGAKDKILGGRLQVDTSIFHIDWSKIQLQVIPACGYFYYANAGQAKSDGFDLSAQALVTADFKVGFSVAYTNSRFTKSVTVGGSPVVQSGDTVGFAPQVPAPWALTLNAEYDFRIAGNTEGYLRADDVYHSQNSGPFTNHNPGSITYNPGIPAPEAMNQLNVRAGLKWGDYDVSLLVNNALNAHPLINRTNDIAFSTVYLDQTLRPRTVGISGTYRF